MSLCKIPPSLLLLFAATAAVRAQFPNEKTAESKPPAEAVKGVWHSATATGDEYVTFTIDGRVILKRGPEEPVTLKYKLDVSSAPWKLDLSGTFKKTPVALYSVIDFPKPRQMRMAKPATEQSKRPDSDALKAAPVMERIVLEPHAGIFQVVEATLKKLSGTWEGKDGSETVTLTFNADGEWTMKVADFTDKGRFRIDVSKLPLAIDLLSSEGTGVKYSIIEFTEEGLRTGKAGNKPEERPKAFDDASARTFRKKAR